LWSTIVDGKALVAANIANIGKASNEASGDFGHNPQGRGRFGPMALSSLR